MPVRKILKSYRHVTGLVATNKSGEMTFYRTRIEHDCQKLVTFNHNIARYEEQPVTITYVDKNGKSRTYIPAILIHFRENVDTANSWKPLLVDVRTRRDLFKNWKKLKPKFQAARQFTKEQEWDFVVLTDREINTPYLKNAVFLLVFIDYLVNKDDMELLLSTLARLYPFLERQNRGSVSLLFSTLDFLNVGQKRDVQKVSLIVRTPSLLFTSPVSEMDKVELR